MSIRPNEQQFTDEVAELRRRVADLEKLARKGQMAVNALREEHERAQMYLDLAGVMFVALDVHGTVTMVNRRGCEILGYEEADIVGRDWFETFLPATVREKVRRVFHQAVAGDLTASEYFENPILTRTGTERMIFWHNALLTDGSTPVGTLSSGTDVTEQVLARAALEQSEQRLRVLVENLPTGAVYKEGDQLSCNPHVQALTGFSPSELATVDSWFTRLYGEDAYRLRAAYEDDRAKGFATPRTVELRRKDGQERFVEFAAWGDGTREVWVMHDVTERERAHRELEYRVEARTTDVKTLQSSRDRFYAMVNHELRNALTAVHGWAELFTRKHPDERVARELCESAEYSVEMLNDLLDLSRLDVNALELKLKHAGALDIANDAIGAVQPLIDESGVRLEAQGGEDNVSCHTDTRRVKQILVNLLRNAIRHTPPPGAVTLQLSATADELRFDVIDTGEGIRAHELEIIFDAYKRAQSQAGGGTGLGLTLCKRLAVLLGGDISVQSVRNQGTTFSLNIPRFLDAQIDTDHA